MAQKTGAADGAWPSVRDVLLSYPLVVEPVGQADAEDAARLWRQGDGLSLADRLCLALGRRLGQEILTADGAWRGHTGVVLVR